MSLSSNEIKEILAILEDSGWDEAEVTIGDVTLSVSKGSGGQRAWADGRASATPPPAPAPAPAASVAQADGAGAAPAPQPAAPATEPDLAAGGHLVSSPSVGVFWRAPEPGAAPFVKEGDRVEVGQDLCIVEIMKLMQQVVADVAGVVTAIHIENGEQVEHGTPLFSIATS